jgi:hypothetical protein
MASDSKKRALFSTVMYMYSYIYVIVGVLFYLFHGFLEEILNLQSAPDRFWVALTTSMMMMLGYVARQSAKKPDDQAYIKLHLLSKGVSTVGFVLAALFEGQYYLAYAVGAVTDGSIFIMVWWLARRLRVVA